MPAPLAETKPTTATTRTPETTESQPPPEEPMFLEFEDESDITIARTPIAELGADSAAEFKEELLTRAATCPWIALDLSNVSFMDSSALGALVAGLKAVRGRGELRVFGGQARVLELFRLTGLSRVFECDGTREQAVAALLASKSLSRSA